jgi:hypothetical protein
MEAVSGSRLAVSRSEVICDSRVAGGQRRCSGYYVQPRRAAAGCNISDQPPTANR